MSASRQRMPMRSHASARGSRRIRRRFGVSSPDARTSSSRMTTPRSSTTMTPWSRPRATRGVSTQPSRLLVQGVRAGSRTSADESARRAGCAGRRMTRSSRRGSRRTPARQRPDRKRSSKRTSPRRTLWLAGGLVFALAFLLRLIYVLQARANPQFDAPLMDPGYHDQWAWSWARGAWEAEGPFFRAPLYPLFLGTIYAIAGHDFLVPRIVQALLGSLSCALVMLIGARLFSRAVGIVAGIGAAFSWILIYFDNELLIPVLFVLLTLGFFYTLVRLLEGWLWSPPGVRSAAQDAGRRGAGPPSPAPSSATASGSRTPHGGPPRDGRTMLWAALSGALFGLAAIARPNILIFLPALAWAFLRGLRRGLPPAAVGLCVVLALLPIGVVTLHNATAGDDLVLIASQGGVNFYIGNNPQSDGRTAIVPGTRADWWGGRFDTIKIAEEASGRELKESEVSAYWFGRGVDFILTRPLQWLGLMLRKLQLFWSAPEIGNNSSIYHLRSYAPIMRLPLLGFGITAPLALAGIYLALRRRNTEASGRRVRAALPLLFVLLYMAGVIAFFVCARYRVPVLPFLLLFAAFALVETRRVWLAGERGVAARAAGIVLVAAVLVNVPSLSHEENLALARFHDGVAWKQKGQNARAERAFRDALRHDPTLDTARSNLAGLLAARGAAHETLAEIERALNSNPRNPKTLANLASYHLDSGALGKADSVVARALAIDPDFSPALRILGVIRERQGDWASAREAYTKALRFAEEPHRLENNLAVLSMKEGNSMEAETHLSRSIELEPTYALAWGNLGALLAQTGRLERAVDALERAIELEPGSPTHWAQLAQVLRQLDRIEEAEAAERRAAALHPTMAP
ncbi:MAG: tetratricopeptide repeat protein [Candidatus Eisenbacteria bacterium]|nr:tetratricopeptide repeat protein [Candidatus Eisenbacteria bacterium]